jgi:DNA invertase Pin-like site-specific DNA recombinase
MKYGYARVSTDDQNPALQLAAPKRERCKIIFKDEGKSGATINRPALRRCLKKLEPMQNSSPAKPASSAL